MRRTSPPPDDTPILSKTKKKEEMHALQKLGADLVALSREQLKRIDLPEDLHTAVLDWQRFTQHEAKRRQLQYIGRLMRQLDIEPIQQGLSVVRGESAAETARLHRLERLREQLLADEKTLHDIAQNWPQADLTHLRNLRRNTLKEKEANKPPKSFRALFQALRSLDAPVTDDLVGEASAGDTGDGL